MFTLLPSRQFKQLDTWMQSFTQDEELELVLYCESEFRWHPTAHSLYRFRPDQKWFDALKEHWNLLKAVTKYVAPLAEPISSAVGVPWTKLGTALFDKLPDAADTVSEDILTGLGKRELPQMIELEARHLLQELITYLDSRRSGAEPKNGGLERYVVEDGRVLWLCPEHRKRHESRDERFSRPDKDGIVDNSLPEKRARRTP